MGHRSKPGRANLTDIAPVSVAEAKQMPDARKSISISVRVRYRRIFGRRQEREIVMGTSFKRIVNAMEVALLLVLLVLGITPTHVGAFDRYPSPDQPGEEDEMNEELWRFVKRQPYDEAIGHIAAAQRKHSGLLPAVMELPTGWKIAPAGKQVEVGTLPHEAIAFAGRIVVLNTGYSGRDAKVPQEISVIDPDSLQVVKVLHLASIFPSAATGLDGDLYISGGYSQRIYRLDRLFDLVREYSLPGYPAGIAAIDNSHLAVAYLVSGATQQDFEKGIYREGRLVILNTSTGEVEQETTVGYFPYSVRYRAGKLYVTLLGENRLNVYDRALHLVKSLDTGRTPQDICYDNDRLYVVNTGSDNIAVIDPGSNAIVSTIDLQGKRKGFGRGPTSCAVLGRSLYVTLSTTNAVADIDISSGKTRGYIPAGWYPTKILLHGKHLLVLNGKGIRTRRPNVDGPQPVPAKGGAQYVLTLLKGSVSIIPVAQVASKLIDWTRQVEEGSPVYGPLDGFHLPIRNVFYIVRENRTYDQVLGDLEKGNGDPYLTLFGREVTPNAHRLAEEFVTLDNFYANGEISVLGHSFTTSGYASPFLEWLGNVAYSGRYKGYPFGMVPSTTSPAYLWDELDAKGIDYRIYGEDYYLYTRAYRLICDAYGPDSQLGKRFYAQTMALASRGVRGSSFFEFAKPYYGQAGSVEDAMLLLEKPEFLGALSSHFCGDGSLADAVRGNASLRRGFAELLYHYPLNFRTWDLYYSDLERAKAWKTDFERQLKQDRVAPLHYIWLPNDHTGGAEGKYLPPDQLVAQNDAALVLIVETISKSPVWKESLILVVEDDAQNGPDHVDATRTVALAAGPYVKRGKVIGDRYDQLSLLRTIEILLGASSLNLNDALAIPMIGIFSEEAVFRPYASQEPAGYLSEMDRALYRLFTGSNP
jgi:YVTN family beta-propeller protein